MTTRSELDLLLFDRDHYDRWNILLERAGWTPQLQTLPRGGWYVPGKNLSALIPVLDDGVDSPPMSKAAIRIEFHGEPDLRVFPEALNAVSMPSRFFENTYYVELLLVRATDQTDAVLQALVALRGEETT